MNDPTPSRSKTNRAYHQKKKRKAQACFITGAWTSLLELGLQGVH
uniref:Uncharacterized protein n=1 Tax=Anguilla anguilla TaxID=7936 RepID=A0A0E9PCF3_ANGAN